jgi:syntaxin 8
LHTNAKEKANTTTSSALNLADYLPSLQKQLDDLTSQFHGFSTPSTTETLTHPNDPSLQSDFTHASSLSSSHQQKPAIRKPSAQPAAATFAGAASSPKTVRFSDTPVSPIPGGPSAATAHAELFGPAGRYRDDLTSAADGNEYTDQAGNMNNQQIHAYHSSILQEQDDQLDQLGVSISRQRELSLRMGDELEAQVEMLDETDGLVDRHQSRLNRAQSHLGKVARAAGESKQMVAIIGLIVILVFLIAVLK